MKKVLVTGATGFLGQHLIKRLLQENISAHALYRDEKINPFSSLFVMIVQIPVFFALYFVFSKGLFNDPKSLYSFVTFPETRWSASFRVNLCGNNCNDEYQHFCLSSA